MRYDVMPLRDNVPVRLAAGIQHYLSLSCSAVAEKVDMFV